MRKPYHGTYQQPWSLFNNLQIILMKYNIMLLLHYYQSCYRVEKIWILKYRLREALENLDLSLNSIFFFLDRSLEIRVFLTRQTQK